MNKHWKPKKLEELSRDSLEVHYLLEKESDLACVLVGASFLSEILASGLKNFFIQSKKTSAKILAPDRGILGSFAARADLAYCLGLIEKEDYQDLATVAQIRNLFAHNYGVLDFGDPDIQSKCANLQACRLFLPFKGVNSLEETSKEQMRVRGRNQFNLSIVFLGTNIHTNAVDQQARRVG